MFDIPKTLVLAEIPYYSRNETLSKCFIKKIFNISKDFKLAKHLKENLNHKFSWKVLFAAQENKRIREILEASEMALKRSSLKEQIESKKLSLFHSDVT